MMCCQPIAIALAFLVLATVPVELHAQEEIHQPGDQLNLTISDDPPSAKASIAGVFTVSKEGKLRLPHLKKEFRATGIRPSVLVDEILKAYREEGVFKHPTVAPRITESVQLATRFVEVAGRVKEVGKVSYRPDLTLLGAISARGGFTHGADLECIRLIRGESVTVHHFKNSITTPNIDVKLRPGDRIVVPAKRKSAEE
ncbi:MAG: SLBB domain-containing protein [Verrucomicrobiales bacterium]